VRRHGAKYNNETRELKQCRTENLRIEPIRPVSSRAPRQMLF